MGSNITNFHWISLLPFKSQLMRGEREKKWVHFPSFPIPMSLEGKLRKDKQENKKHTFSQVGRWKSESMSRKRISKMYYQKGGFYKICPIREALKLSEGFTKTLLHTLDKIGIPASETDGVPAQTRGKLPGKAAGVEPGDSGQQWGKEDQEPVPARLPRTRGFLSPSCTVTVSGLWVHAEDKDKAPFHSLCAALPPLSSRTPVCTSSSLSSGTDPFLPLHVMHCPMAKRQQGKKNTWESLGLVHNREKLIKISLHT